MSGGFSNVLQRRGVTYELSLTASGEQLQLRLVDGDLVWSGAFKSNYVEEITHKTGHFQTFATFVQMLSSSLMSGDADGVECHLDVLTYADLQALKNRRKHVAPERSTINDGNTKRYVILTRAGRERVHYPLPLSREASAAGPAATAAAATTHAQIREPDAVSGYERVPAAHPENRSGSSTRSLVHQYDELLREKEEVQAAYERLQRDSSREIARVRRRSEDLAQQLQIQAEQMEALQGELMSHGGDARTVDRLRSKLQRLEQQSSDEVSNLQRVLAKHKKEVILLNSELSRSKREEERLRRHVRELEAELKILQRRAAASAPRDSSRATGRASSASTASRVGSRPSSTSGGARPPYAARATASSRASSVASSTASSRANSVERHPSSRNGSRSSSRAPSVDGSRLSSRDGSRAGSRCSSADRSRPVSRASSAEHSRPPSRDSRSGVASRRPAAPPSLERAAREALLQTARRPTAAPASSRRTSQAAARPPLGMHSRGVMGREGRRGGVPNAEAHLSNERQRGSIAVPKGAATRASSAFEDAHKENRTRHAYEETPPPHKAVLETEARGPSPEQYDATDDINDIDRRLNALQQFLEAAKAPR